MIEKIIEKIDNYNLFTSIVPGILFILFNHYYFGLFDLKVESIVIAYFIGQTLNRIGSIFVEKFLFLFTKEKGESYSRYLAACKEDKKIQLLLQERNMFRTFCSLSLVCILEIISHKTIDCIKISRGIIILIILVGIFVIYAIAFCKHNKYIAERIRISNKKK